MEPAGWSWKLRAHLSLTSGDDWLLVKYLKLVNEKFYWKDYTLSRPKRSINNKHLCTQVSIATWSNSNNPIFFHLTPNNKTIVFTPKKQKYIIFSSEHSLEEKKKVKCCGAQSYTLIETNSLSEQNIVHHTQIMKLPSVKPFLSVCCCCCASPRRLLLYIYLNK